MTNLEKENRRLKATIAQLLENSPKRYTTADLAVFDEARRTYKKLGDLTATARGEVTEMDNFVRRHKDWKQVLPYLKESIINHKERKDKQKIVNDWVAQWKNFQTWINNRCWEEDL